MQLAVRPKWILFDAADTLLRPTPGVADVYCEIAGRHGVIANRREIKSRFAPAIRKHFADERASESLDKNRWRALVFDVLQTDNQQLFDELWEHFARPSSWELFEDVEIAWSELTELGYQLAIASNFDARLLEIVQHLPPISTAKHVFISSQLGYRKPSKKFFAKIEDALGCEGNELLLVGDNETADYGGAVSAGWQAIHLVRRDEQLSSSQVHSLRELSELLAK